MDHITFDELYTNYGKYTDKYVRLKAYYAAENIYKDEKKDDKTRIISPSHAHFSVGYYLTKLHKDGYEGWIGVIGKPGNKMYVVKSFDRIISLELLGIDGSVTGSIFNDKIPLPKNLKLV